MSTFLLIRHAETDAVGRSLSGRAPDVHLNERGRRQAVQLIERLQTVPLEHVCSSPRERACETAAPLAEVRGLTLRVLPELDELEYGEWQGRRIESLSTDRYWQRYNRLRSIARIPEGELLIEAQLRMLHAMEQLADMPHEDGVIALVGHADPIKALLMLLLGMPLDFPARLEIAPASVSAVAFGTCEPRLLCLNLTGALPRPGF